MMQGDEYALSLVVEIEDSKTDASAFENIEFCFGKVRKTLSEGGIVYNEEDGKFKVYMTQRETFALKGSEQMQIRFKFLSGEVVGVKAGTHNIDASISKVVL